MVRTQEGFLAEDDLGASDVYERENAETQEVRSQLLPLTLLGSLAQPCVWRPRICGTPWHKCVHEHTV